MKSLLNRHVKLYFRDKWTVFFSLLSVLIVLMLFAFFLSSMIENQLPEVIRGTNEGSYLVYSWVFSGLLMVSSVTVPLGFLGTMVSDKDLKKASDFYVSPLKRSSILASYLLASVIVTMVLNGINLLLGLSLIYVNASVMLPALAIAQTLLVMLLMSAMFSAMMFYIVLHLKTENSHGTLSTLVGTLIGFLGGLYVPPAALSATINTFLSVLPPLQMTSLIRHVYMDDALTSVFVTNEALSDFRLNFGVDISLFNTTLTTPVLYALAIGWTVLFTALSLHKINRHRIA